MQTVNWMARGVSIVSGEIGRGHKLIVIWTQSFLVCINATHINRRTQKITCASARAHPVNNGRNLRANSSLEHRLSLNRELTANMKMAKNDYLYDLSLRSIGRSGRQPIHLYSLYGGSIVRSSEKIQKQQMERLIYLNLTYSCIGFHNLIEPISWYQCGIN